MRWVTVASAKGWLPRFHVLEEPKWTLCRQGVLESQQPESLGRDLRCMTCVRMLRALGVSP